MKPKIFIGSSVEGLSAAYSIQQNLTHDADVTVWDQGVFELSKTTIESLLEVLSKSDFGIFVFSPDDVSVIRKENKNVVRDNVIFEFGLFIGKLGRDRVFFVVPSGLEFHLPTDLLGITPGKYDPNREDKSLQAATGPVCHQIRLQLKKLGTITTSEETAKEPELKVDLPNPENQWFDSFIKKNYSEALQILESLLAKEKDNTKIIEYKMWHSYCIFRTNELEGLKKLDSLLIEYENELIAHRGIARIYLWEEYFDKAISILENALKKFDEDETLIIRLSECYKKINGTEFALDFLEKKSKASSSVLSIERANIYTEMKDYDKAREIIHSAYILYPNNASLRYKYARIAMDLKLSEIALYFLRGLTSDFPEKSDYWGYLSNCCVDLEFYDTALSSARKANELNNETEEWINSNIGNILKNKGFYTEGIKYLEKGLSLDKDSEYAHDRLSSSLKLREEELNKIKEKEAEGRKLVRQYKIEN